MRSIIVGISIALVFAGAFAPRSAPAAGTVPCAVFAHGSCASPFTEGVVDGQWIGVLLRFTGSNGGADSIDVVSVGFGGNGLKTLFLGQIKPEGQYGDRMWARIAGGKLYVFNAVYLPGEAHCCYTHDAVQRYGFHDRKLERESVATVPLNASQAEIDKALAHGMP